eukprot:4387611-Pyramimonas_sp.AAC.1
MSAAEVRAVLRYEGPGPGHPKLRSGQHDARLCATVSASVLRVSPLPEAPLRHCRHVVPVSEISRCPMLALLAVPQEPE